MKENLINQGLIDVKRYLTKIYGVLIEEEEYKIAFYILPVRSYISTPLGFFRFPQFGHTAITNKSVYVINPPWEETHV